MLCHYKNFLLEAILSALWPTVRMFFTQTVLIRLQHVLHINIKIAFSENSLVKPGHIIPSEKCIHRSRKYLSLPVAFKIVWIRFQLIMFDIFFFALTRILNNSMETGVVSL